MNRRLNVFLAFVLALVLALLVLIRIDYSRPNYQVILGDDMTYSPAFTSFEANVNFPNGQTAQHPVPGTIARGAQPIHFEATPQDALRAGEELVNPFVIDSEDGTASVERGARVYQIFCIACHGADGTGNGPVARRGFPPPPSLLVGKSRDMKDGQLFHILTFGQNTMPPFAAQLPPDRRWDVINFIRRLQQDVSQAPAEDASSAAAKAEPDTATPPDAGNIAYPDSVAPTNAEPTSRP